MRIHAHVVARLFRLPILRIEADVRVIDDVAPTFARAVVAGAGTTTSRRRQLRSWPAPSAVPRPIGNGEERTLAGAEALLADVEASLGPRRTTATRR